MSAAIVLKKGDTHGFLKVIGPTKNRYLKNILWKFRCKRCNKITEQPASAVRRGIIKSCGCLATVTLKKGKTYHFLKYLGPAKTPIKVGKEMRAAGHFLCTRCGKPTVKSLNFVHRGNTKSCGCLQADTNTTNLPSSSEKRRRYRANEEKTDARGKKWLSLAAAAKYLGVSKSTVLGYAEEGLLAQRRFRGGLNRKIPYYSKEDLKSIKDERSARSRYPEVPGFMYFGHLVVESKLHETTVKRKLRKMQPKVKRKKVTAIGEDGRPRTLSYVPHWACEKLGVKLERGTKSGRGRKPDPRRAERYRKYAEAYFSRGDDETAIDVAARFEVSPRTITLAAEAHPELRK